MPLCPIHMLCVCGTCVGAPPEAEVSRRLGGKNKQQNSNKQGNGCICDEPADTERELSAGSTFIHSASNNNKLDTVTSKDHRWFGKIKALKSYVESNIWDSNGCAVIWQDHHGSFCKMVMLIHWLITRCHGQSANKILCNRNNKTRSLLLLPATEATGSSTF